MMETSKSTVRQQAAVLGSAIAAAHGGNPDGRHPGDFRPEIQIRHFPKTNRIVSQTQ